ncbi:MAG: PepSY domain-containing protein [Alphaproteobacteria bacterium]|nr:PepSY domain-containing protein [Alphaproteobacteria bacterium SS10]
MNTQNAPLASEIDAEASRNSAFYRAAWRWHFYAGLYVVPFLIMLAITGTLIMWSSVLYGRDGEGTKATPQEIALPVSEQAAAALATVSDGTIKQYIAPKADDLAAIFRVDTEDGSAYMVAIDPYTGDVAGNMKRRESWYEFFREIHGTLLIGVTGERMIEIAASLAMVLIATGLYLWWPRGTGVLQSLAPNLALRGRPLWKSLHVTMGVWTSLILVVFLITGLSWAGVWGSKFVQPWNTFPAEKWDNVPLSDLTHASLNHGVISEVPWALEQTPMPASGSQAGLAGIPAGTPVTLDNVVGFAHQIGFDQRFQLHFPRGETGVWTIARDSMSNDSDDPYSDRTVHIDRYTGNVLADVSFADYSVYAKAMAVGVAFHVGFMGIWNLILNTLFCLLIIFVCVSGVVMWWMRRPASAGRLVAPSLPANMPLWQGAVLVGLILSLAFPLAGLTLIAVLALDLLILSRIPVLKRAFS